MSLSINIVECNCGVLGGFDLLFPCDELITGGPHFRLVFDDEEEESCADSNKDEEEMEFLKNLQTKLNQCTIKSRNRTNSAYDPKECSWWVYINPPAESNLNNPDHKDSKRFRNRFRVPYLFFKTQLLPFALAHWPNKPDVCGNYIPTEYKLMAALRVLGRGLHFDDVAEIIHCGDKGETLRVFFHAFCNKFAEQMYPRYVRPPETDEEIREAMSHYAAAGMPGAFCSTDGVHFKWDELKRACEGSKKYPSLTFNGTVGHNKKIYNSTRFFYGTTNDLTMARWDAFL
jgi:hypothetical protein